MRTDVLEFLCCPACKGEMVVSRKKGSVWDKEKRDLIEGGLWCVKCRNLYRVVDRVPVLIDPKVLERK